MKKKAKAKSTVPPAKFLSEGNEWNVEGLRAARTKKDGDEIICTATKTPLFYKRADSVKIMLNSFGLCENCDLPFHISYLHKTESFENTSWPIEYDGLWCNTCWSLPSEEWSEPFDSSSLAI